METACPRCGYSNNGIDVHCANCALRLPETQAVAKRWRFRPRIQPLHVFVAVALVASLGYVIFGGGNWIIPSDQTIDTPDTPDLASVTMDNSSEAWIIMCDFMKERVRTPGTAVFPALGEPRSHVAKLPNGAYEVLGYVEFEGEGNQRVRRYYKGIVVQYRTGLWKLQSFEMDYWDMMARFFVGLDESSAGAVPAK